MATRLYGLIWKWHFAMGLVASPLIAIVAITGALYSFEPEIERWGNAHLLVVEPEGRPRPVDELRAVIASRCDVTGLSIPGRPDSSYVFYCRDSERALYVDPYRATFLGEQDPASSTTMTRTSTFFHVVFALHWELMLGERGRLVIEWATSWTLLLLLSGAILWWPRGKRRWRGVAWPRGRLSGRQWLRDLHAVFGAYALPAALCIAATGLMWTLHAGDGRWNKLVAQSEAKPPSSHVIEGMPRIGIDAALAGAQLDPRTDSRTMWLGIPTDKDKPDATYSFWVADETNESPSQTETIVIDAFSGTELQRDGWDRHSTLGKVDAARYAIHVGALLGLPGRIAACVASLILAMLCITGPWMWWKRRPRGGLGIPPVARTPWSLYAIVAVLGWLLPTVGVSLLALTAFELCRWLWSWWRTR